MYLCRFLAFLCLSPLVLSQVPYMVEEVLPESVDNFHTTGDVFEWRGSWYFLYRDGRHGLEIYVTDGTDDGGKLFLDINPGPEDGAAQILGVFDDKLVFAAYQPGTGYELWASDGPGDATLISDVGDLPNPCPDESFYCSYRREDFEAVLFKNRLYFNANDKLWSSDFTLAGFQEEAPRRSHKLRATSTHLFYTMLKENSFDSELWAWDGVGQPVSFPYAPVTMVVFKDKLYFVAYTDEFGDEIWESSGTPETTRLFIDIVTATSSGSSPNSLLVSGDQMFFFANNGLSGQEPWVTDGNSANTRMIADLNSDPFSRPVDITLYNGLLIYQIITPDYQDGVMLATDGTPEGSRVLTVFDRYPSGRANYKVLDGILYFNRTTSQGDALWRTDGTSEGTRIVWFPREDLYATVGGNLWLRDAESLYRLDLTDGARIPLPLPRRFRDDQAIANRIEPYRDGVLFLDRARSDSQPVLRFTDGLNSETLIDRGPIGSFRALDDRAFFISSDNELVQREANGDTLELGSVSNQITWLGVRDPSGYLISIGQGVFSIDPARSTLNQLGEGEGKRPAIFNNQYYFGGRGLFVTDGVADFTDISTSATPQIVSTTGVTAFDSGLVFSAYTSEPDKEPWFSDGTAAGTRLLKNIRPFDEETRTYSSEPKDFTALGGVAVFSADDGSNGRELWRTDGTEVGTILLKDINPGSGSGIIYNEPPPGQDQGFAMFNGVAYFAANDGVNGMELWRTDGTNSGTFQVLDIMPGPAGSNPAGFTVAGGVLWFRAATLQTGYELWRSEGNAGDTQRVVDLASETASASPRNLVWSSDTLYFRAETRELESGLFALPPEPFSDITAPAELCAHATGQAASVRALSDESVYLWAVQNGTIHSGQGTEQITFTANSDDVIIDLSVTLRGVIATSQITIPVKNGVPAQPGAISGKSAVCPNEEFTLTVPNRGDATDYLWTVPSDAIILEGQGTNSIRVISGSMSGDYSIQAINVCGASGATVHPVTVQPKPVVYAGPDLISCDADLTLDAFLPAVGQGSWRIVSGQGGSLGNVNNPNSSFSGQRGETYVLEWRVDGVACPAPADDLTIVITESFESADAGPDSLNSCGPQISLAANNPSWGAGIWTVVNGSGGSFSDTFDPQATFTGVPGTTYTLRWTLRGKPCDVSSDDIQVRITPITPRIQGGNRCTPEGGYTLLEALTSSAGSWSIVEGPSLNTSQIDDSFARSIRFTPNGGSGAYRLRYTPQDPICGNLPETTVWVTSAISSPQLVGAVNVPYPNFYAGDYEQIIPSNGATYIRTQTTSYQNFWRRESSGKWTALPRANWLTPSPQGLLFSLKSDPSSASIYRIDHQTGEILLHHQNPDLSSYGQIVYVDGHLFMVGLQDLWVLPEDASEAVKLGNFQIVGVLGDRLLISSFGSLYITRPDPTDEPIKLPARNIKEMVVLNNTAYFTSISEGGDALWRTDGTPEGTGIVDFPSGLNDIISLAVHDDYIFFTAYSDQFGRELYRTDGGDGHLVMIGDIAPGPDNGFNTSSFSADFPFLQSGGDHLWLATTQGLWRASSQIGDLTQIFADDVRSMQAVDQGIYFVGNDIHGFSDGTPDGLTLTPEPESSGYTTIGGFDGQRIYLRHDDQYFERQGLEQLIPISAFNTPWGASLNGVVAHDAYTLYNIEGVPWIEINGIFNRLQGWNLADRAGSMVRSGDHIYIGSNFGLFILGPEPDSLQEVSFTSATNPVAVADGVVTYGRRSFNGVWHVNSDGLATNISRVEGGVSIQPFTFNGTTWLRTQSGRTSLWTLDGDLFLEDISIVGVRHDRFFFIKSRFSRVEVWESNGQASGTRRILFSVDPGEFYFTENRILRFRFNEGWTAFHYQTGAEASLDLPLTDQAVVFNNRLHYSHQGELWRLNQAGPQQVTRFQRGQYAATPSNLTVFGDKLYFLAHGGVGGAELYATDGWCTSLIKDFNPGSGGSNLNLHIQDNALFIAVDQPGGALLYTIGDRFVHLPDDDLRQSIINRFDLNNDGKLSLEEARSITTLDYQDHQITTLKGLESMPNLTTLRASGNRLTDLTPLLAHPSLGTQSDHVIDLRFNRLTEENCPDILALQQRTDASGAQLLFREQNGDFTPEYSQWPQYNVIDLLFGVEGETTLDCVSGR